jgi:AcrR family transcriptional regulator
MQAPARRRAPAKADASPPTKAPSKAAAQKLSPRGEQKRVRILDAAAAVLAERGFAGTTLSEIAERAGTQAGSLYYHFDSREDLIEQVLCRGVTLTTAHVRDALDRLPPTARAIDRLAEAVRQHVRCQLVVSDYARAAARSTGQVPADMRARINREFRRYGALLDGLIAAAVDEGAIDPTVDRSALRMLVIGAANWTPDWFRPGGRSSVDELADLLVRLMLGGVGTARRR